MFEIIVDSLIDTLKIVPYLLITFLILEVIEHKLNKKSQKVISKYQKTGPIIGGILGGLPQCGFSAMASSLYTERVITMGTLIAIFLSTSDEMLPIMLGEHIKISIIVSIILFKVIVGIIVGLTVDLIIKSKVEHNHIEEICEHDHCDCEKGIFLSSLIHTLKTSLFILLANLLIGTVIHFVGTENLSNVLKSNNIMVYFLSSLIGLIPNCAASVILTEMYLSNIIPIGVSLSGLLTGSGIGILLLFKSNKSVKENLTILSIIYLVGVLVGFAVDIII